MFTKGYVLSDTEFRLLVADLIDDFVETYGKDVREEDIENFLEDAFEALLEEGKVDMIVVLERKVRELYEGEEFVDYIRERYGDLVKLVKG
jgi:hypothetical protein